MPSDRRKGASDEGERAGEKGTRPLELTGVPLVFPIRTMTPTQSAAHELRPDNRKCVTMVEGDDKWVWLPTHQLWYLYDGPLESQTRNMSDMASAVMHFSMR